MLALQTFADEAEAIAMANDTEFGLAAMVFTGDQERAERVSARLVAGTVWVNCFFVRDLRAPFGGIPARPASAARAAPGRSTSSATSRTPCSRRRAGRQRRDPERVDV